MLQRANRFESAGEVDELDVVADRGYFDSEEILACDQAGITATLPKPQTSGHKAKGRFVKADFRYAAAFRHLGLMAWHHQAKWKNNRIEGSHVRIRR